MNYNRTDYIIATPQHRHSSEVQGPAVICVIWAAATLTLGVLGKHYGFVSPRGSHQLRQLRPSEVQVSAHAYPGRVIAESLS